IARFYSHTITPELLGLYMDCGPNIAAEYLWTLRNRGLADNSKQTRYYRVHDLAYSFARSGWKQRRLTERRKTYDACQRYLKDFGEDLNALNAEVGNLLGAMQDAHEVKRDDVL